MTGVGALGELLDLMQLAKVQVDEVAGRRLDAADPPVDGPEASSPSPEVALSQRFRDGWLIFRGTVEVHTRQARLYVDVAAHFRVARPVPRPADDILDAFARRAGLPVIYPYLRAELQQLARQLGVPTPLLRPYWDRDFASLDLRGRPPAKHPPG